MPAPTLFFLPVASMQWNAQLYLFMYFFFLLCLMNRCYFKCYPPFFGLNCRTSSNCVNNNRSRVSSVFLFVTSCDPPPQLTHSLVHSSFRAPEVLYCCRFFSFFKCRPLWPHSCCFLRCCRRRHPTFRSAVDTRQANLSRKTRDFVVHNSLWCTWLCFTDCFFF